MSSSKVFKAAHFSPQPFPVPEPATGEGGAERENVVRREAQALELQAGEERQHQEELERIFAQGLQAGRREAEQQVQAERDQLSRLSERLAGEFQQMLQRLDSQTVDLSLAIVRKIVGNLSQDNAEIIRQSIRKALSRRREPGDMLILRLHPEDHQRLAPSQDVAPKNLKLVADVGVGRGGCVLETRFGLVNAQLDAQLEEIGRGLRSCDLTEEAAVSQTLQEGNDVRDEGRVTNVVGMVIESRGPAVTVGEQCEIVSSDQTIKTRAEVIGFRRNRVLLMSLGDRQGIGPGDCVIARGQAFTVEVGPHLLGRVLNGLGQPIDDKGVLPRGAKVSIHAQPNNPMQRKTIEQPLYTGVRAIDGLLTCGKGVRMGIFAGSGVGKSLLLGMMGRNTQADVNVIALIGERGREVKEFVERDLGPEGLQRSVVIAVTSDESPVLRIHGALLAASVAEYFAQQGRDVLFMMDSVTRYAMALREIGLAAGEPPATKGYPPSTFAALPKLLERSGVFQEHGSITGFYTVLVEGDDLDEPVADHVRSILDGHIVLSRALSAQNHFPAIAALQSVSRLTRQVCTPPQLEWAGLFRDHLSVLEEAQDLVNIGAYAKGSNPRIDRALEIREELKNFLKQNLDEKTQPEEMWHWMGKALKQTS